MKKYNVVLTEEQLAALLAIAKIGWDYGEGTAADHVAIFEALQQAEPTQEKVWLPFTTLKDGGTYLTRDGKEVIVVKHPTVDAELLSYPWRDKSNIRTCWDNFGRYNNEDFDSPEDLVLELQPS